MVHLTILDFNTGDIDIYPVSHIEDEESVIEELGHNPNNCQWMISDGQIIFHKEILK